MWRWDERGSSIVVDVVPLSGSLRVEVSIDRGKRPGLGIELPPRALGELAEWLDSQLDEGLGYRLAEVEAELATIEDERDAALAEVARLRAALTDALPEGAPRAVRRP